MSIRISSLIIEVTRRCNIQCAHCLRGNAQRKDIDLDYVEHIFKQIDSIGTITFTGGEPSLVPHKIMGILELAKKYNIEIENFYCATNGVNNSKKFALAMLECRMYCSENDISSVDFSNDQYHEYEKYVDTDRLYVSQFKFFGLKNSVDHSQGRLIKQGRNKYDQRGRDIKEDIFLVEIDDWNNENNISICEGNFYLNVLGELIAGCDFSYEDQKLHIFGTSDMNIREWAEKEIEKEMVRD